MSTEGNEGNAPPAGGAIWAGLLAGQLVNVAALAGAFLLAPGETAGAVAAAAIAGLNTYLCVRLSQSGRPAPPQPPVILKLYRK